MKMPAQPNQSLIDGIACLQALATSGRPMGCRELGRILGLEATRVNRLLKTLSGIGIAAQNNERKYGPGPGIHVLASLSLRASGLLSAALPYLENFKSNRLNLALGVLWKDCVSYLYYRMAGKKEHEAIASHDAYPASISSIGQVLLSAKPDAEIEDVYGSGLIPGYENLDALFAGLSLVRERGGCVRVNDRWKDVSIAFGIGFPVIAAIAVSGPIGETSLSEWEGKVRGLAATITSRLGK